MSKEAFSHVVIRASAGTGKTYQLAVRFIGLLAAGARPDEILATTFTRKAAGEILDRVLFWLADAAADESARANLAQAIGLQALPQQRCRELLLTTLQRMHALRVGTLDSYFLQVATNFGQELGLPPGWSICEELIDGMIRDEAIDLLLSHGKLSDLLTLVHALTKGATSRSVSRLVHDTVGSLFELYRETSPEAWRQIQVCKGHEPGQIEETLKSLSAVAIDGKRMATARQEDIERFLAGDWENFIDKGLAAKVLSGENAYHKQPLPKELIPLYKPLLKHAESILVGQVARQTEATHQLLTRFAEHYQALQLDERALRFSDVTFRLANASTIVGPQQLAFRLDGGIRHVLLDEFQDTSPAQWRVLRPLAEGVARQGGGTFFCVGDAKQAIYGWRGGVAAIFDCLDGQIEGLMSRELAKSFRSAQSIIDAVNAVFLNLTGHPNLDKLSEPVRQWQAAYSQHTTERAELQGHVTLATAPQAADGEDQTLCTFQYAAERIRDCVTAAPQASVGVLVRTNTAVARLIYLLRNLGIQASEEGGNPLVDSPAVELILSLLRLADHPGDSVARFHLANSPLAQSLNLTNQLSGFAAAGSASGRRKPPGNVIFLSQGVRKQLLEQGYGATVFHHAKELAPYCNRRDLSRLQQLVELAYDYQPLSTLRTTDFIRLVETRRVADPQATDVRVMTIHQAKGLEFDIVVLPELEARLVGQPDRFVAGRPGPSEPVNVVCRLASEQVRQFFPPALQKLFEDDMCLEVSESLCVLYVAMTRAVHALHMIIAPARPNERTMPKSFAGLLRATLAPGKPALPDVTLYEHGDAKWYNLQRREGEAPAEPRLFDDAETRLEPRPPIQLAPSTGRRERALERTSPSALEGGARLAASTILAPRSDMAFGIGTLVHAWLELIEWLDDGPPSDDELRSTAHRLRAEIGQSFGQLDAHIARFRKQLGAAPIANALSRQFYNSPGNLGLSTPKSNAWPAGGDSLDVQRERAFAIRSGDEILSGSIDRLVVVKSGGTVVAVDVIDFKTDEIPPGDKAALDDKVQFYQPQIDAYRKAACAMLGLNSKQVTARLVFVSPGLVCPVERSS